MQSNGGRDVIISPLSNNQLKQYNYVKCKLQEPNRLLHLALARRKGQVEIWFCHANCLCAMMYFYNEVGEEGKKTPMVQLYGFFNDQEHARRCIKDGYFRDCSNFHFYAKEMDDRLWKMVKTMVKHGIKVTIE